MNVLITGGAGFIGSHLVQHLGCGKRVRVLDNMETGCEENLLGTKSELIRGDVQDRQLVRRALRGVDRVFHLAGKTSVAESTRLPGDYARANTHGLLVVLEEAARAGVKGLCFFSTSAVYGSQRKGPLSEPMLPCPESPYAISKLEGEAYCQWFRQTGRLMTVCLRCFNVYGPRQAVDSPYAPVVPIFARKAVQGAPLPIYGNGRQTRDFVYVADVVSAATTVLRMPHPKEVYNVASGTQTSILELAKAILDRTASRSKIQFSSPREGEIHHSWANIGRLRRTGFRPRWNLQQGLLQTLASFTP